MSRLEKCLISAVLVASGLIVFTVYAFTDQASNLQYDLAEAQSQVRTQAAAHVQQLDKRDRIIADLRADGVEARRILDDERFKCEADIRRALASCEEESYE